MKIQQQLCNRLYELLPHKKELVFGCIVVDKNSKEQFYVVRSGDEDEGFDMTLASNKTLYLYQASSKDTNIEIIGSPLTLSDVLMAIKQLAEKKSEELNSTVPIVEYIEKTIKEVVCKWDLSKTADEQSDEVCEFLLSILK